MSLVAYKFIAAFILFLTAILILIYPIKKHRALKRSEHGEIGEALASGIFLGAALFHMLPDSVHLFNGLYPTNTYPFPEVICAAGFLTLLFLERFSLTKLNSHINNTIPILLALTLSIHALIEGAALGMGATYAETIMLFVAIIAHKGSETFALCIVALQHQLPLRKIIILISIFALMTPLGIFLGESIHFFSQNQNDNLVAAIFNAFAAGTFLYISTLHHVHFHQHSKEAQGLLEFSFLFIGVCAMAIIAVVT